MKKSAVPLSDTSTTGQTVGTQKTGASMVVRVPEDITRQILRLGSKHGMTPDQVVQGLLKGGLLYEQVTTSALGDELILRVAGQDTRLRWNQ